jgi:hypothetical protein
MPIAEPTKVRIIHNPIATNIRLTNFRRGATGWPRLLEPGDAWDFHCHFSSSGK